MFKDEEKCQKNAKKYYCTDCNFSCSKESNWNNHLITRKHINRNNNDKKMPKMLKIYACECGKQYKYSRGLWEHKQKCNGLMRTQSTEQPEISNPVDSSLILELLNQNKELHQMVIELAKKAGNTTNNTNNTINNNNKFNLNVFLNETCKDAINLNDFIQSIELTINDFTNTGEVGYVRGISNIMLERIRDMEPHVRPIHCTDLKRETVYVKDSDIWAKEDANKTHIRKAVRIVANKNKEQIHSWIQENPNYEVLDTPECDKFFEYSKASLGGYGKEENNRFENKIISNILTETTIDKKLLE